MTTITFFVFLGMVNVLMVLQLINDTKYTRFLAMVAHIIILFLLEFLCICSLILSWLNYFWYTHFDDHEHEPGYFEDEWEKWWHEIFEEVITVILYHLYIIFLYTGIAFIFLSIGQAIIAIMAYDYWNNYAQK